MSVKIPVKKRAPMTPKEKAATALKIGNPTRSMTSIVKEVYNPKSVTSATSIASQLLTRLDMDKIMRDAGFSYDAVAQNTARIAFTATKQNQYTGEIEQDNKMQLEAMKFGSELMDWRTAGSVVNNTQNNITVTPIYGGKSVQGHDGDPEGI
jgi:hypothetical protein